MTGGFYIDGHHEYKKYASHILQLEGHLDSELAFFK